MEEKKMKKVDFRKKWSSLLVSLENWLEEKQDPKRQSYDYMTEFFYNCFSYYVAQQS